MTAIAAALRRLLLAVDAPAARVDSPTVRVDSPAARQGPRRGRG
jgi:hypothetical protein